MPPARCIHLTPGETGVLKHLYRRTDNAHVRLRCKMILLYWRITLLVCLPPAATTRNPMPERP
jgi:hypothetical protein